MFGKKKPVRSVDAVVERALAQLRDAVARRAHDETIVIQPGEGGPDTALMVMGKVAQRLQDAGYIINNGDTQGQVGLIDVRIPLRMIEGTQPVP
jgi:hypothetical protein